MNVLDLLLREYTPRWAGNSQSDSPFRVLLRSPSRAWMLRLDALVLADARRARERLAGALRSRNDGDDEAATERAAGVDLDAMEAEADNALAERRRFVEEHLAAVKGLTVPAEALAFAELPADATVVDFVLAQNALTLEIEQELRRRGTVTRAEGKG